MTRVLVIGKGFLGDAIIKTLTSNKIDVIGTHFHTESTNTKYVDVQSVDSIRDCISDVKPDAIVNCAANTNVDFLEKNPKLAFSINSEGAANVAKISNQNNLRLIHISTDSVFDGKRGMYSEEDIPNPINVYSKSKAEGEKSVKENSANHVIVRTNFYGRDKNNRFLFNWVLDSLRNKRQIVGFSDVFFTPLEISNLSKILCELLLNNYVGTLHLASDEMISKYDFAKKIARTFSLDENLIKNGSIDSMNFTAKRPKNTSLKNDKSKKLLKTPIISLDEWLNEIKHNHKENGINL